MLVIFRHCPPAVLEEGLVNSYDSDDFRTKLSSLLVKWSSVECTSSTNMDAFIDWFDVICNTMIRSVREECGLGNPPDIFTSESINAVLKHKVDSKNLNCQALWKKSARSFQVNNLEKWNVPSLTL